VPDRTQGAALTADVGEDAGTPEGPEIIFTEASAAKIESSALTLEYVTEAGARPVHTEAELLAIAPEFAGSPWARTPGVLFPWRDPQTDDVTWQLRPDEPARKDNGDAVKYAFAEDHYAGLGVVRRPEGAVRHVLLVEGTLQSLAVARYAPPDALVLSTPGCWGWSHDGRPAPALSVVDGHPVTVFLDADTTSNRDVYDAGVALAEALAGYGATSTLFARVPVRGTNGIDDYLSSVPEDARAAHVERLAAPSGKRANLPADRMPEKRKRRGPLGDATSHGLPDPNDTWIATSWADRGATGRWRVLVETSGWLGYRCGRWEASTKLGPYDDVARYCHELSQQWLVAAERESDDEEKAALAETARMLLAHRKIDTVLSRATGHSDFHVRRDDLDQHPTLWPAGNGVLDLLGPRELRDHDPELLLTVGSDVVYDPEATCPRFDAFLADILPDPEVRGYVMRLFGAAMFGEVRANAQVFTVFVGSGRNGKGALIRTVERVFGRMAVTVDPRTLQEAKFEGHSQEVAKLAGKRLATAQEPEAGKGWNTGRIKSWTGGDRLTGRFMGQNDFEFAPSHTLIVTANDRPPVSRSDSAFWMRYREVPFEVSVEGREDPGLESFIAEHELPGVLNRILAGLDDYLRRGLDEPAAVRAATHEAQVESDHLAVFAETHLVHTRDEADRLLASDVYETCRKWWAQHVRHEAMPSDRGRHPFAAQLCRVLGIEAAERNPRKTKVDGVARLYWHGLRWADEGGHGDAGGPLPGLPGTGDEVAETPSEVADISATGDPELGNRPTTDDSEEGSGTLCINTGEPPVADIEDRVAETKTMSATPMIFETPGHSRSVAEVAEVADIEGVTCIREGKNGVQKGESKFLPRVVAAIGRTRQPGNPAPAALPEPSTGPVVFDIETGDSAEVYTHPDPEAFVRIAGIGDGRSTTVVTGPHEVVERVATSRKVIGHNIVGFDLVALARVDPRIDVLTLARQGRVHDTMIVESLLHPLLNDKRAGAVGMAQRHFALDATAERYGVPGKTDDLKALAKTHGGFDAIPVDDEAYRAYCGGDVDATVRIAAIQGAELARRSQRERDYVTREHRVHAIASTMGAIGLAVDEELLQRRFWHGYGRKMDLTRRLVAEYGIPTVKADGKPADSPAATKDGKAAVLRAFHALGADLSKLEQTKGGKPAFGREPMARFAEAHAEHPRGEEIGLLCSMMGDVAGVRTVYSTALEHLHADGRVHPQVATLQASGRWSVTKPGLTVFGKRGDRVIERAVFTASSPDHRLFAIDLSQIDARAIAVHSQDHAYMALFEPGLDAHEIVARMVWGDAAYDANPKGLRQTVKAITHGLPYGMGVPKLAVNAKVDEAVAQGVVDTMNERFPRLQAWKDEVREVAATGAPLDNGFGRMMLPDPERAYTQGVALMGQGTARDLMMECLLRLPDELARCLRAQVHDEAVFECHVDDLDEVRREVEAAFNFEWCPPTLPGGRPIRIEAEAGHGAYRWSDAY
jgi:P4 family phage/plasmid primase-like protien